MCSAQTSIFIKIQSIDIFYIKDNGILACVFEKSLLWADRTAALLSHSLFRKKKKSNNISNSFML